MCTSDVEERKMEKNEIAKLVEEKKKRQRNFFFTPRNRKLTPQRPQQHAHHRITSLISFNDENV